MNRLIDFIIIKYKYVLIAVLLITIPLGYLYTRQKFDNDINIYFDEDDPDIKTYRRFQEVYGNEEQAIIVFKDDDIFNNENIGLIRLISERVKKIEGVQRLFSITEEEETNGDIDSVIFKKIIPEGNLDRQALTIIKKKVLNNELLTQYLISSDGTTAGILIEIESIKDVRKKRELMRKIMASAMDIAGNRINLRFSGAPFVEDGINALSERDYILFSPIIIFVIFFIVVLLLKKISISFLCQFNLGLIGIWTIGFFVLCGETMNMVTTIIAPILLAVSVADAIHLLAHYKENHVLYGNEYTGAISYAVKSVWLPCFFTSITTATGFLSFIVANVRPIKIVGIFTAIGVMAAFIITVTFLPAALLLFKIRFNKDDRIEQNQKKIQASDSYSSNAKSPIYALNKESLFTQQLSRIGAFTISNYRGIALVFIVIVILAVIGIFKITFETSLDSYLPDGNTIKSDIKFIENNLGGNNPYVILVAAKSEEYDFTRYNSLKLIDEIQNDIMTDITRISSSFSIADYFKEINKAFNDSKDDFYRIPMNQLDIIDYYEIGDADVLERIISSDRMEARISFQFKGSSQEEAIIDTGHIDKYMKGRLGKNYSYKKTGLSPLSLTIGENLQTSQIKSFLSAFALIFIMMFFVCRNAKLAIISMIPNLFPIFLTLGIMGWLNISLNVTTIMIASITMGIAVDDTIHYIIWFRRNSISGMDTKSSLLKTYKDVGKPLVITTVVLCLGFSVLILGSIKPTQAFGMLTAVSMFFALAGDLFVLPALILIFRPRIKKE